jgi:hypothetical protein
MRKKKPKLPNPTEKSVELSILQFLATIKGMKAWKNQTTGVFDPVRKVYRPLVGKYTGRGSSDILCCYQGRFIAIEVKRPTGSVLSLDQKKFLEEIILSGGIAFVAKSIDDVKEQLKIHF